MWIKMLKTYAGPLGLYPVYQKFDVPKQVAEGLKKAKVSFERTCPPWDEKMDRKAVKHDAFLKKVDQVFYRAEKLIAECRGTATAIENSAGVLQQKEKDRDNAVKKAKKLAKSAGLQWPPEATNEDTDEPQGQADEAGKAG